MNEKCIVFSYSIGPNQALAGHILFENGEIQSSLILSVYTHRGLYISATVRIW